MEEITTAPFSLTDSFALKGSPELQSEFVEVLILHTTQIHCILQTNLICYGALFGNPHTFKLAENSYSILQI